jgi:hypothetical protein
MNTDTTTQTTSSNSKVFDNGPKWGSYVGPPNANGFFEYDQRMHKERPYDHYQMILERTNWVNDKNRTEGSKTPKPDDHPSNYRYPQIYKK